MTSQLKVQKRAGDQNTSPCSGQRSVMHTALLELQDFRSYTEVDISLAISPLLSNAMS